jgi:hypothetical protein
MPAPNHRRHRRSPTEAADEQRPTARQLSYLRALAHRTGQTFTWPATRVQASCEIRRLRQTAPTSPIGREFERFDWAAETAAREANCDVPIRPDELEGYGSNCQWSH